MSITGSNNPYACEPVVFANANAIVSLGTITRDGNEFTFSVGFVWKINGVTYQNTAPVVLTIAEASTGFQRIDNALLNTSNTIDLQQGLESETIALRPAAPDTNIILTSWNISGDAIGDTETPILGTQFKKKTESLGFSDPSLSGTNAVIQLRPEGNSRYAFSNPGLISIDGFGTSLISGNPNAEAPYDGKDLFIVNTGANAFTLIHDGTGLANSKFFFIDETNLVIPAGGKVWLKYGPSYCEVLFKSWGNTINSESRTIMNRWTLTNLNEYYRSRGDYAGFNVEILTYTTFSNVINQMVASLSGAFYRTSKSKKISKIYVDGAAIASGITSLKLGVFAFQRATVTDWNFSAVNLINLGEFTFTKTSGVISQSWELTPTNIEIPTNYLVSCVLMKTDGTGSEVNLGIDFKIEDYAV